MAGALARVSILPEVLLEIILEYLPMTAVIGYSTEIADFIPGIFPSIEPSHVVRTLSKLSRRHHGTRDMMRAFVRYPIVDQIRVLNDLTPADIIRFFHIGKYKDKNTLRAAKLRRGSVSRVASLICLKLLTASKQVQFVLRGQR